MVVEREGGKRQNNREGKERKGSGRELTGG